MASSPQWKVYRGKEYIGCCKYAEDAAALVSLAEEGSVKHGHSLVVWREGREEFSASDSYDGAAAIMEQRRYDSFKAAYEDVHGKLPASPFHRPQSHRESSGPSKGSPGQRRK